MSPDQKQNKTKRPHHGRLTLTKAHKKQKFCWCRNLSASLNPPQKSRCIGDWGRYLGGRKYS